MDDLVVKLSRLSLPSRSDDVKMVSDLELNSMLAALLEAANNGSKNLNSNFRKLRELATARQTFDDLLIKIYEASLYYSLDNQDLPGFCICANRLVGEIYDKLPHSSNRNDITCLLLLYFALDISRNADFASVYYKINDDVRRSEPVQYALDVYMALKRCDYVYWARLMERADSRQMSIIKA